MQSRSLHAARASLIPPALGHPISVFATGIGVVVLVTSTVWAQSNLGRGVSSGNGASDEALTADHKPLRTVELPPFERDRVYHVAEADGTPSARGATYKARFGVEGASYTPFLGSAAPRSYPVAFRLVGVSVGGSPLAFDADVAAARADDTIRYDRGSLIEVYELGVESIEQLFVFEERSAGSGELVIRVAVASDLTAREIPERIDFENHLGAVRYGRATALDADGNAVAAPTRLTSEGIEIRVPASFVASARFPLTVDPVVSTFTIDTNPPNVMAPDCAYDASTARWLVVHEEIFNAVDHDVVWRLVGVLNGQSFGSGYVDTSLGHYWANPACANNNGTDSFFVVAQVGVPGQANRRILGKTLAATNGSFGTELNVGSEDPFVDLSNPDVGGDPYGGLPSYYAVVWEKTNTATDHDLYYRMVDPGNSLASETKILDISANTVDSSPSISKSNNGDTWNVCWARISQDPSTLRGARINWDGSTAASSFAIPNTLYNSQPAVAHSPSASTSLNGTQKWAVAFQLYTITNYLNDVGMILLDGTTIVDEANVSALEAAAGSMTQGLPQRKPNVDSDGHSFAVAYEELAPDGLGGHSYATVRVSTVAAVGTQLKLSESHVPLPGYQPSDPAIASVDGAGLPWRLQLIAYVRRDNDIDGDITGALYDNALYTSFCHPGFDGVAACPCGNDPSAYGYGCDNSAGTGGAQLVANGVSSVGSDTLVLTSQFMPSTALTIFNQGNAFLTSPAVFGQGLRCVGGSIKRLYMKTASEGVATAPAWFDPNVHTRSAALGDPISVGSTRAYYAYYRDPTVLGGCPSGSTYNATQSVQAVWIP